MQQQNAELNALLGQDLSNVPTTTPLLQGLAELKVSEIKVEPAKNNPNNHNINIKLLTQTQMLAQDGRTINPGFPIYHTIALGETEKYGKDRIAENLAKFREWLTGSTAGQFAPVEQYIGLSGVAKLKIQPETNDYPAGTRIAQFVKKG